MEWTSLYGQIHLSFTRSMCFLTSITINDCRKTELWNQCCKVIWSLWLGIGENSFLCVCRGKILLPGACIFNIKQSWKSPVTKLPGNYQREQATTVTLTLIEKQVLEKALDLWLVPCCPVNCHKVFWGWVSQSSQDVDAPGMRYRWTFSWEKSKVKGVQTFLSGK